METLQQIAKNVRVGIIKSTTAAGSGHPGGSLSAADILTALYFKELNVDPKKPYDEDRDRFVLSKGHSAPALYSVLAEKGYFGREDLLTLRKIGSDFQGHPDMHRVNGVDMTTGSLGQGISAAIGMALGKRLDKSKARIYALLGDGEIQEGIVWEAFMSAAHYKLDNLCVIIDHNGLQIDGKNSEVMNIMPLDDKLEAFGFNVININGHSFDDILSAFEKARECKGRPSAIIANTVKGKGVSFMENEVSWHGKSCNAEEEKIALAEIGGSW